MHVGYIGEPKPAKRNTMLLQASVPYFITPFSLSHLLAPLSPAGCQRGVSLLVQKLIIKSKKGTRCTLVISGNRNLLSETLCSSRLRFPIL